MQYACPACKRAFGEPGFCPFDGAPLAAADAPAGKETILSAAMPAEQPPTEHELRRGTFPLTPTPPASMPTQEVTAARTRLAPATSDDPTKVRAVSASDNATEALEAFRTRQSEYDKLVGETLDGRYFVIKKIGEGGMGVVFSARHAVIERPLAIKVLKREVMRDTATIKRFVQEAKAASRIGHPNIVDVTDFGTTPDGMTYSVMEYVAGKTLGAALRESSPFPPVRAIKIATQVARALGAAHDKGIVHRDLKPENIFLVDRDGRTDFVKIVDFGIAKVAPPQGSPGEPRLTRAGSVFGTPEYMAPEQAAGRGDTDGRVDIYALGIILYEMICGRVPHRADSMVRTLAMQMLDPVEPPTKVRPDLMIPPELEEVIMHALAKKRENRYQTMGELLKALEDVLPMIGKSLTGSPVYALAPLPPGADPDTQVAAPPMPLTTPDVSRPADSVAMTSSRSRSPTNQKLKHEPQFTSGDKPSTFEHVWTESELPTQRRRWPLMVMFALIAAGAAGAVVLVLKSRSAVTDPPLIDAGIVTTPIDAAIIVETTDGGLPVADAAFDAADDMIIVESDAGVRIRPRHDAGAGSGAIVETPNRRGTIMIQVITKPDSAALYVGNSYRGRGPGLTLEEPYGAKLDVTCRQNGYKDGKVQLVFNGEQEVALCELKRIKICIDNVKNPFDDCEVDPNKPMP